MDFTNMNYSNIFEIRTKYTISQLDVTFTLCYIALLWTAFILNSLSKGSDASIMLSMMHT